MVTPENAQAFVEHMKLFVSRAILHEVCSGTGALSYQAFASQVACLCPIDFRYGWDLGKPEHQLLVSEMHNMLLPFGTLVDPSCQMWSERSKGPDRMEWDRESERSWLCWLVDVLVPRFRNLTVHGSSVVRHVPRSGQPVH